MWKRGRIGYLITLLALAGCESGQGGAALAATASQPAPWLFTEDTSVSQVDGQSHFLNSRVLSGFTTMPTTGGDTTGDGTAWFDCDLNALRFNLRLRQGIGVPSVRDVPRIRIGDSRPMTLSEAGLMDADEFIYSEPGASAAPLADADTLWIQFTPKDASVPWTAVIPMDGARALVDRLEERCNASG